MTALQGLPAGSLRGTVAAGAISTMAAWGPRRAVVRDGLMIRGRGGVLMQMAI